MSYPLLLCIVDIISFAASFASARSASAIQLHLVNRSRNLADAGPVAFPSQQMAAKQNRCGDTILQLKFAHAFENHSELRVEPFFFWHHSALRRANLALPRVKQIEIALRASRRNAPTLLRTFLKKLAGLQMIADSATTCPRTSNLERVDVESIQKTDRRLDPGFFMFA